MKKIIAIGTLLFPLAAAAQNPDLFSAIFNYLPVKTGDTVHHASNIDLAMLVPIKHSSRSTIAGSVTYHEASYNNFAAGFPKTLYGSSASLYYQAKLDERREFRLMGKAGLYGDYKGSLSDEFRWSAGFIYYTSDGSGSKLGLGLSYSKQFYGNQLTPLVDMNFHLSDRLSLRGLFPVSSRLEYKIDGHSSAGVGVNIESSSYRLEKADSVSPYLKISQWTGLLYYKYNIYHHWHIFASAGFSPTQKYEVYNQANTGSLTLLIVPLGKKVDPVYSVNKAAANFQIGVIYSLFGDYKKNNLHN
jgi:hypothetical protein